MSTIGERVRMLRKSPKIHLSMEAFGQRLGVGKTAISKIELGENTLTQNMKLSICREFHVNQEWLETGEGEMFIEINSPELQEMAKKYALDEDAVKLIENFVVMPPDQQRVIIDYVRRTAESMKVHNELDRQMELEKSQEDESSASFAV